MKRKMRSNETPFVEEEKKEVGRDEKFTNKNFILNYEMLLKRQENQYR